MMYKSVKQIVIALAAIIAVGISQEAQATFIQGEMSITGYLSPTGGDSLLSATGIDFMDAEGHYGTAGGAFAVGAVSGDFATFIPTGNPFSGPVLGDIKDFSFEPFSSVSEFWKVNGFSFDLLSLVVSEPRTIDSLVLRGYGEIYGNNFERTNGSWVLTANGGNSTFSWSATAGVPETGSLLLLGIGLIGLGTLGRFRKQ